MTCWPIQVCPILDEDDGGLPLHDAVDDASQIHLRVVRVSTRDTRVASVTCQAFLRHRCSLKFRNG